MDFNFSYPTITGKERKIEINDNTFILIKNYKKGASEYSIITLHLKDKKVLVGKFNEEFDNLNARYKDGRVLVYFGNGDIKKVLSLYEMVDDTFYSCTEEEAINIFDNTLDVSHIQNKNRPIYRMDSEKTRRIK